MGLFNSLTSQFERLSHAMDDQKTLSLGAAAAVMRIRREKVDAQLARMHKKGLFGSDKPYVDDRMEVVVRDRRYAHLAMLLHAAAQLLRALDEAQQTLKRLYRVTPQQLNTERARVVGNFVRDVVDSAIKKGNTADMLRSRTGELMRDLIAPSADKQDGEEHYSIAQTMALMNASAAGIRDFALAHPDARYDEELSQYLLSACRQVEAWNSCGASLSTRRAGDASVVQTLETRLASDFAPGLMNRLDELHHAAAHTSAMQQTQDDPLLQQLQQKCSDLRALSRRAQSPAIRNAMARVNALLDDILTQLCTVPESRDQAGARSLRVVYLPMIQELLEKYIRYETRASTDQTARQVLQETEQTLSEELPQALQKLLRDLRAEDFIDLEAHNAALRQKMQLDGLLRNDSSST